MERKPLRWPTYAAEVLRARESLRIGDEVGLALRAERQRLGLSQRAYAAHRGWTLGTVIRLESAADAMKLGDVDAALADTAFQLCLCHRPPGDEPGVAALPAPHGTAADSAPRATDPSPSDTDNEPITDPASPHAPLPQPPPQPQPVHPAFWPRAELVARVRGGRRRFPAHHVTEQVGSGPPWWWYAESSRAGTVPPNWYAPQYTQRRPSAS
ncbi:MAG TPA: hypothetical protein VES93_03495 [Ornithinibacter sp.]|nr:hypothetical protein [Ornithinibacter sp.]